MASILSRSQCVNCVRDSRFIVAVCAARQMHPVSWRVTSPAPGQLCDRSDASEEIQDNTQLGSIESFYGTLNRTQLHYANIL